MTLLVAGVGADGRGVAGALGTDQAIHDDDNVAVGAPYLVELCEGEVIRGGPHRMGAPALREQCRPLVVTGRADGLSGGQDLCVAALPRLVSDRNAAPAGAPP